MTAERAERRLAAIVSADVVGYSRLMSDDEVVTVRTLNEYRELMTELVREHRGRVVDFTGDNLLAEFPAALDAARCALAIQAALDERNAELPLDRIMAFRMGIHLGDVLVEGERIHGDGVNIAARLESLATPGGICVSDPVHDRIKTTLASRFDDLGEQEVGNLPDPIRVWRMQGSAETKAQPSRRRGRRRAPRVLALVALLAAAGGAALWTWAPGREHEITSQIVATLEVELGEVPARRAPTSHVEAYDAYLQAAAYVRLDDSELLVPARRMLRRAIELDPEFADAIALLGITHVLDFLWQWNEGAESLERAQQLSERALALDPGSPAVQGARAITLLWSGQLDDAIEAAQSAIALDPNETSARLALFGSLVFGGQPREGMVLARESIRRDPFHPAPYLSIGHGHFLLGELDEAIPSLERALEVSPNFIGARVILVAALAESGDLEAARAEAQRILDRNPRFSASRYAQSLPYADPAAPGRLIAALGRAGLE